VYGKGFIDTIREEREKTVSKKRELADVERELSEAEEALRAQKGDGPLGDSQMLADYEGDYEYKEAKTWDGLEAVGNKENGDWRELPLKRVDEYTPYVL